MVSRHVGLDFVSWHRPRCKQSIAAHARESVSPECHRGTFAVHDLCAVVNGSRRSLMNTKAASGSRSRSRFRCRRWRTIEEGDRCSQRMVRTALERSVRELKETSKKLPRKLPIFFSDNAGKQCVARKSREVYWKAPECFSVWWRVLRRIRSSDYESAALTS